MEVYVNGGEGKILVIVKIVEKLDIDIESLNLWESSLEDVYLHYTGKMVREEESNISESAKLMV